MLIGTPCSIGHAITSRFGGSSSTINEAYVPSSSPLGTPSSVLSTRPDFSSETDIRKSKTAPSTNSIPASSVPLGRNNIQHSTSSSALRASDYSHQVTYTPQSSSVPIPNLPRSQSVHPSSSYNPDSLSNRPINNIYTSTTSLNSTASNGTTTTLTGRGINTNRIPLTRKSITEYPNRTYRVIFSDDSEMIICHDYYDGQKFIDAQGKEFEFDRRDLQQSEAIQERLALFNINMI